MLLIAFGHRSRVGKDTAARFLKSELRLRKSGSNIQTRGFADKLKDVCYQLYSWAGLKPGEYYETEETSKEKDIILPAIGMTPRDIWIKFGTLVAREVYGNTWVDYLFHNIKADICVIKDLRFPNEANRIKDFGGLLIKIEREVSPNETLVNVMNIADDPLNNYDKWDCVINNNGTLRDLNNWISTIIEKFIIRK